MIWRSKAHVLAFVAFAFGALLYGPVNALVHHDDHGSLHHHDVGHHATVASLEVPAHCLFCLDGIAPQPTEPVRAVAAERRCPIIEPAPRTACQRHSSRSLLPPSRAPPVARC